MSQFPGNPKGLKRDGSDCDLTIYAKDSSTFRVHKDLLCAQSGFFKTLFNGDWKETQAAKVVLDDATPDAIDLVLDYIYKGRLNTIQYHKGCKCPESQSQSQGATDSNDGTDIVQSPSNQCPTHQAGWHLDRNVQVYLLADYLCIQPIKQSAFERCASFLKHIMTTESLAIPITNILKNTGSTDPLRMEALWYCVSHMWRPLSGNASIEALLQQEEPVAYALLGRQKRAFDEAYNTKEAARAKAKTQRDEALIHLNVLQTRGQNRQSGDQRAIRTLEAQLDNAWKLIRENGTEQTAKIGDLESKLAKLRVEVGELRSLKLE